MLIQLIKRALGYVRFVEIRRLKHRRIDRNFVWRCLRIGARGRISPQPTAKSGERRKLRQWGPGREPRSKTSCGVFGGLKNTYDSATFEIFDIFAAHI